MIREAKTGRKLIRKFIALTVKKVDRKLTSSGKAELKQLPEKINSHLWRLIAPEFKAFPELEYLYNK